MINCNKSLVINKFSNKNFSSAKLYTFQKNLISCLTSNQALLRTLCPSGKWRRGAPFKSRISRPIGRQGCDKPRLLPRTLAAQRVINRPAHLKSWPQLSEKSLKMKIILFGLFLVSFWALSHSATFSGSQHVFNNHERDRSKFELLQQPAAVSTFYTY